jgi:glycosyltransferase involved in cell wall biosynthesis
VLYVCPVGERGGAETTLLNILRLQDRTRFTPSAVLLKNGPLVGDVEALGLACRVVAVRRTRRLPSTVRAIAAIRRIIRDERIDVVFGHMAMGHVYGGVARLGTPAKAVWFQHGIVDRPDLVDRLAARLPASIVLVYSAAAERAQRKISGAPPIVVVHGGVELERLAAGAIGPGIRRALGLGSDALVVACIGRLQYGKGQAFFLEAIAPMLATVPELHVLVVGGTLFGLEQDYPAALRAQAARSPAPQRIHFLGQRDDIADVLRDVDLLVHSAVYPEAFGLVIVEAMAMGVPVVATRSGGPEEIVLDGVTGLLVPVGDLAALGSALAQLLDDPQRRKAMGEAGRDRARRCFTAERMVGRVEQCLQEVVAR